MIDFFLVKSISSQYGEVAEIYDSAGVLLWTKNKYKENFADNTWEQIIRACQNNEVPDTWKVGDTRKMITMNGFSYDIRIIGKNHDEYSNGSGTAPLTFQFAQLAYDFYGQMAEEDWNECGWEDSYMRTVLLPEAKSKMPQVVRNAIKNVSKSTNTGMAYGSGYQSTNDGLFLLSEKEFSGKRTNTSLMNTGTQYEYYKTYGTERKYFLNGETDWEWLRSPDYYSDDAFVIITSKITVKPATRNAYFAPAFCF